MRQAPGGQRPVEELRRVAPAQRGHDQLAISKREPSDPSAISRMVDISGKDQTQPGAPQTSKKALHGRGGGAQVVEQQDSGPSHHGAPQ
jgi:hypothetical protein